MPLTNNAKLLVVALVGALVLTTGSVHATQPGPWSDRAHAEVTRLLKVNGPAAAASVLGFAHPTGEGAALSDFDVRHVGAGLSVRITVTWKGGLIGTRYATVVVWEFDRARHRRAVVLQDNAPLGVTAKNARKLDGYFRDEMYPILRNNLGS